MKILDATCGMKSIWYQKNHPFVTFMDKRYERGIARSKNCNLKDQRHYEVKPDVVSEWKDAPFPDDYFDMIVFDPPHKIGSRIGEKCAMEVKYGRLYSDNWKQELQVGIKKLFDILKPEGIFVFKWAETDKQLSEVLSLFPYKPLFGTRTGCQNKNHWIVFLKYNVNMKLDKIKT